MRLEFFKQINLKTLTFKLMMWRNLLQIFSILQHQYRKNRVSAMYSRILFEIPSTMQLHTYIIVINY